METLVHVFSCEFCEIFKSTFFTEQGCFCCLLDFDDMLTCYFINPFNVNVLFLHPLKTPEYLWFSEVFRGYRIRKLAWKGLTHFMSLASFYTPCKHYKILCFLCFKGIQKEASDMILNSHARDLNKLNSYFLKYFLSFWTTSWQPGIFMLQFCYIEIPEFKV